MRSAPRRSRRGASRHLGDGVREVAARAGEQGVAAVLQFRLYYASCTSFSRRRWPRHWAKASMRRVRKPSFSPSPERHGGALILGREIFHEAATEPAESGAACRGRIDRRRRLTMHLPVRGGRRVRRVPAAVRPRAGWQPVCGRCRADSRSSGCGADAFGEQCSRLLQSA